MGGSCSAYVGRERHDRVLVEKPEGNRPLGRPEHRWENNIKMNLQEAGCGVRVMWRVVMYRTVWLRHQVRTDITRQIGGHITTNKAVFSTMAFNSHVTRQAWKSSLIMADTRVETCRSGRIRRINS
jgi:hypothetical protein